MARKPNYQFERQERDRAKAIKLAEKASKRERDAADEAAAANPDRAPE